jgi:hypothetical protein
MGDVGENRINDEYDMWAPLSASVAHNPGRHRCFPGVLKKTRVQDRLGFISLECQFQEFKVPVVI